MYRIIGDIHGRTNWKQLVDPNVINIFVGDYFDPYDSISFEELKGNFLEIIEFKKNNPDNCILLLGNHDLHYFWCTGSSNTSRFDYINCWSIHELFDSNKELFQMAFSIGNVYLVTHAGVTSEWAHNHLPVDLDFNPDNYASAINLLLENEDKEAFSFESNCKLGDVYGMSPQQSCVWVRPQRLVLNGVFRATDYHQIVGHTQVRTVIGVNEDDLGTDVYLVDCLGSATECLEIAGSDLDSFRFNTKTGTSAL